MTVAITIPTYNRSRYLEQAIASVQAQTFRDWRLLVVDDGSTDETAALVNRLSSDPRIRLVMQPNGGPAAARNRGILELGDAEFVAFLDDDDTWLPKTLETLMVALKQEPTRVASYRLARMIDVDGNGLRPGELEAHQRARLGVSGFRLRRLAPSDPTTFDVLAFGNAVTTPGLVLIRRSALDAAGTFEEPSADWQTWLRLSRQGPSAFVPEVVIGWRWHPNNMSRREVRMSASRLLVSSRLLFTPGLRMGERTAAWIAFARYYLSVSRLATK